MTTPAPTPQPEPPAQAPKELREHAERLEAENKSLRDTLLNVAFDKAGIGDTSKGLGKTMREAYKGEPEATAIAAWAKEHYDWQPPAAEPTTPTPTPNQQLGEEIAGAQQRIEAAIGDATPADPNTIDAQIVEAEKRGDFVTSLALKSQKLMAKMVAGK